MSAAGIVQVALGEVGYLEKASNSQLDSKTANAGYNNYTKYWVWYGSLQGNPWCFQYGTLIHTPTGERKIEDLRIGDYVIDGDGVPQKVEDTNHRLADNIIGLRVNGVPEIITTTEHPFLVKRFLGDKKGFADPEWVPAGEIRKRDRVALHRGEFGTKSVPLGVAYMAGRFVGDGWHTIHHGIDEYHICCSYDEAVDLEKKMNQAGISYRKDHIMRTAQQYYIHKTNAKPGAVNNELLISIISTAGMGASNKRIPDDVWNWDEECTRAFFEGYYDADGSKGPGKYTEIVFSTVSKELAIGMGILLRHFGINLNIRLNKKSRVEIIQGRSVFSKDIYQCTSTGGPTMHFDDDGKYIWATVRQILEDKEPTDVVNLTIANSHTFIADGLVVHNCDAFVSWCAAQSGEVAAVGKYAYCPSHVNFFKNKGQWFARGAKTPQAGDIIFFQSGGEAAHVGIVEYVSNGYVHTIEGNTSGTTGLVANGGGVWQKSYALTSSYILGYGRPAYSSDSTTTTTTSTTTNSGNTLNGIDIASYQAGIDISALTTTDFVIVKSTQGVNYTNPYFVQHIEAAIKAGKKIGTYHYANGVGAEDEADYFISVVKPYLGKIVLALDWETGSSSAAKNAAWGDISYAKRWLDRVKEVTGITPIIYTSQSVANGQDWSSVVNAGYQLWLAQYPNYDATNYRDTPWRSGNTGAWNNKYIIHQYTSSGYITGYSKALDLNKFYGSASDWDYLAKGGKYTIGWNQDAQGWWYADTPNSYLKNQWLEYKDDWYFFSDDGYMTVNKTIVYDGNVYMFDANGKCTSAPVEVPTDDGDDEEMTYEKFVEYIERYNKELAQKPGSNWSQTARDWAVQSGLFIGNGETLADGTPNYIWQSPLNREQFAQVLYRYVNQNDGK